MKRKAIACILCAAMTFTVFAGYGEMNLVYAEEEKSKGSAENEELYGFEEPVDIKLGLVRAADFKYEEGQDGENNPWMDLYREYNIIPEVLYEVDSSQGDTKMSTAIMSGNYPDILDVKPKDYSNYVSTGVVADITEAFETYASDELKKYLNADGGAALNGLWVDGKLYGLPALESGMNSATVMFIRKDWLDNLGLEVPTTMEELKEVAHAFTYNDPDGDGQNNTYGLAVDGVNVLYDSVGDLTGIFEGFGAYPGTDAMTFLEEDGKVVWGGANVEAMKEALGMLQEMYNDGSITKDFITMDSDSIFEETGAGRCGIWFGPMWGAMVPSGGAAKNDKNAHIIAAEIPDGTGNGENKTFLPGSMTRVYCVSSQCKNPEVLVKMMNLSVQKLCNPESEEEFYKYYGEINPIWKCAQTQTLPPMKNYDNYKLESAALIDGDTSNLNMEQKGDYTKMKDYLEMKDTDQYDPNDPYMEAAIGLYTVFGDPEGSYAALDKISQEDRFITSCYDGILTEKMSENSATLKKLLAENIVKIITGDSVDNYDKVLENWYTLGGTEVLEEAQEWLDSSKK